MWEVAKAKVLASARFEKHSGLLKLRQRHEELQSFLHLPPEALLLRWVWSRETRLNLYSSLEKEKREGKRERERERERREGEKVRERGEERKEGKRRGGLPEKHKNSRVKNRG